MRVLLILWLLSSLLATSAHSQSSDEEPLSYKEIPPAPSSFRPGNVLARMIDGLGYRFYWATEGLRPEDLAYRPTEEARSTSELIDHILSLSTMVANAAEGTPNTRAARDADTLSWSQKRERVLSHLLRTRQQLVDKSEDEIAELRIIFRSERYTSELPYWNIINGPLADAIYHTGQIVSFRRTSGNPMDSKVNVFEGKNRP